MKFLITFFILPLAFTTKAQTIKLDYEPQGKIIKLQFDSLTIFTDTTSVFYTYRRYGSKGLETYDLRVKRLIVRQFAINNPDTIIFSGSLIPFEDGIDNKSQEAWVVEWAILHLTKGNRLKIYDKSGHVVTTIKTKIVGTKKEGYVRRAFINVDTKEELFSELIFARGFTPSF